MHAIGTSHNCFSCIQADELHENRHRKIAELLAEYKISNGTGPVTGRTRTQLEELPLNLPYFQQTVRHLDAGNGDFTDENEHDDVDDDDDARTVTDTTTSTADDSDRQLMPAPKPTKAETRALKKAAKVAKSQLKASKNQQKHIINVRTADVSFVAEVLHGDNANTGGQSGATHPLASDRTIEEVIARNMGFMSSIEAHKKTLLSSIAQRRKSERERRKSAVGCTGGSGKKRRFSEGVHDGDADDDEMEDLLVAVLVKLGVDVGHARSGGCPTGAAVAFVGGVGGRKSGVGARVKKTAASSSPQQIPAIIVALKALVKDDLERFENEQRETCVRAGGFWRYVGRPVFERMTKIATEVDWKTGMILKDINKMEMEG
ncbi:uncharacterized protein Z519_08577 [Cladophialophora bantiana CBS 173.52]|uniref:Uncharacterized protein n=1 Tax=Cladophialophora bantiana (strain ATCC 10958 / CBS 173.52 / CDC B-1940 / NIH 8579) TaxID=1442370 RepID=A0A0D2I1K6_CLAB1|nr:uncharacterized protein Z519_08577 [Cladophialophora bantiana CBS 173.52]KIW90794.1 hypothetical protein Z519_08577 [Cladophialophora bantiana CBS 173.52]